MSRPDPGDPTELAPESAVLTARTGAGSTGIELSRFSATERALHWTTAVLLSVCALTGLVLYVGALSALVGRRTVLKDVHVFTGLAMPVPLLLAYAGRWRASVRDDVRRLARWTVADRRWLRSFGRKDSDQVGKFNAGQKANAAFIAGVIPLMVVTGSIMRWPDSFSLSWRTGATFVHDWTAIATWVVVAGHVLVAFSKPEALRSMVTGRMLTRWARRHHPLWAQEMSGMTDTPS